MAEEIKKTTRGRKPKTVVEEKEVKQESQVEEKEVKQESQDEIIKQLMAKIEEQNNQYIFFKCSVFKIFHKSKTREDIYKPKI